MKVLLAALTLLVAGTASACTHATSLRHTMLSGINRDRSSHYLPALGLNRTQNACAQRQAQRMRQFEAFLTDPSIRTACLPGRAITEIVGVSSGHGAHRTERDALAHAIAGMRGLSWSSGCTHGNRCKVNGSYRSVGIGLAWDGYVLWYAIDLVPKST